MAACESQKQDSNITGLSFAEEECLKQLPDGGGPEGSGQGAVWYGREPNSYTDFGGENTMVARSPIDPSRQNKKGTVVDLDASGGWNEDFTKDNQNRLLQGFFFADARQLGTNAPLVGAPVPVTAVAADGTYTVAAADAKFASGDLVFASGFGASGNNGIKLAGTVQAADVVLTGGGATVDEAAPPATATLMAVGHQFAAGDLSISLVGGQTALNSAAAVFVGLGFMVGEWIVVADDTAANAFANNVGYARIKSITAGQLVFDDITWNGVAEAGAGKTIRIYRGVVIRNEKEAALIKRRSYNIERTLGMGENGVQAEYLEGAVANELTVNLPQAEKVTVDLSFVACDNTFRSGDAGDLIKPGTRVSASGQDAYNTTSNLYRVKMAIHDATTSNAKPLFGFVSEATLSINNGVTPNKALGVMGAFDTSAANFEVGGSATVYFSTVAAVRAVRNNADVGYNVILAARNSGSIWDIPLLSLGGGRVNVEKDQPITLALETSGAENAAGYTMSYHQFPYLPSAVMPQ